MKRLHWFSLCVILQGLFLLGWAGYHEAVRQRSPTIRLNVLPVDPRDVFRGDYMILNYEVSSHPAPEGWSRDRSEAVVFLRFEGDRHVIDDIQPWVKAPEQDPARPWVRAEVYQPGSGSRLELTYGIERLFVPEGRGTPRFDRLQIEASIGPSGRLQIKQAFLDGETFP